MLYAAMTFWLLIVVLSAWGVHQLWSGLIKPRVVNSILLPGTLLAQIGRVVGTLVSGGTVNNTTLMKDDEAGEPAADDKVQPKVPVIGPILIALLPLIACGAGVYLVTKHLGPEVVSRVSQQAVAQQLPATQAAFWALLRETITVTERTAEAMLQSKQVYWKAILFLYLVICLTVRMAPMPGNVRGSLGAILLMGLLAAAIGTFIPGATTWIRDTWPLLSFSVAVLILLLMISLLVRGAVGLINILARKG